ncbi:hypothetical protein AOQ84DRAFT_378998 [Glonium stellatum]|uniref:Uncharacterized protein n=1 Tax=Glonium stellatum TaxID=574774 RepID=A0A8E2EWN4_9PEZI|nr:hypothetical protein AOQ84DRAFT_378998 [Glonium stellatum]
MLDLPREKGSGPDIRCDETMAQHCQFNGLFTLTRAMEEPRQLDVDLTILDYLLFKSTESMLRARIAELDETVIPNWESPEIKIEMTHGAHTVPIPSNNNPTTPTTTPTTTPPTTPATTPATTPPTTPTTTPTTTTPYRIRQQQPPSPISTNPISLILYHPSYTTTP